MPLTSQGLRQLLLSKSANDYVYIYDKQYLGKFLLDKTNQTELNRKLTKIKRDPMTWTPAIGVSHMSDMRRYDTCCDTFEFENGSVPWHKANKVEVMSEAQYQHNLYKPPDTDEHGKPIPGTGGKGYYETEDMFNIRNGLPRYNFGGKKNKNKQKTRKAKKHKRKSNKKN